MSIGDDDYCRFSGTTFGHRCSRNAGNELIDALYFGTAIALVEVVCSTLETVLTFEPTMDAILYYLVDSHGRAYVKHEAQSFAEVAREFGLTESKCQEYRFDLSTRRLFVDRATPASALAVQEYVSHRVGSPDRLMKFAEEGHLPKHILVNLLSFDQRRPYLDACRQIERRYTEACIAENDPCLESGCSVEGEDEVCLQPLLNAGLEYQQACAAEWLELFRAPANRIDAWKN